MARRRRLRLQVSSDEEEEEEEEEAVDGIETPIRSNPQPPPQAQSSAFEISDDEYMDVEQSLSAPSPPLQDDLNQNFTGIQLNSGDYPGQNQNFIGTHFDSGDFSGQNQNFIGTHFDSRDFSGQNQNFTAVESNSVPFSGQNRDTGIHSSPGEFSGRSGSVDVVFRGMGLQLKREWLESCFEGLMASQIGFSQKSSLEQAELYFAQFLVADMNDVGNGVLPSNVNAMHGTEIAGPFILQVDETVNISSPLKDRYKEVAAGPKRCLKLSMTDGVQRIFGIEYRPIKELMVLAPAGLKIAICNVHVRRGLLILVPEVIEVLGGFVDHLEAARQRLVEEVNKPPRGQRSRRGEEAPSLSSRARRAAWPPNTLNDQSAPSTRAAPDINLPLSSAQVSPSAAPVRVARQRTIEEFTTPNTRTNERSHLSTSATPDGVAYERSQQDFSNRESVREGLSTSARLNQGTNNTIPATPHVIVHERTMEESANPSWMNQEPNHSTLATLGGLVHERVMEESANPTRLNEGTNQSTLATPRGLVHERVMEESANPSRLGNRIAQPASSTPRVAVHERTVEKNTNPIMLNQGINQPMAASSRVAVHESRIEESTNPIRPSQGTNQSTSAIPGGVANEVVLEEYTYTSRFNQGTIQSTATTRGVVHEVIIEKSTNPSRLPPGTNQSTSLTPRGVVHEVLMENSRNPSSTILDEASNPSLNSPSSDTSMTDADAVEHPIILSGDKEMPFTYMACLLAKWTTMKDNVSSTRGKIKCFLTGVKGFQFKGRSKFELHAYIDDGSLISEVLIDHHVVQSGIGHSPEEVTASLSSSNKEKVALMKETLKQFQLFLAKFEGIILVEVRRDSPPVVLEMNRGCPSSDAWLLLGRLKLFTNPQTTLHRIPDPIYISP
ncbi:recQ-mediated genome instability protein 1 [Amborella trichopoda]|uniref:RecQ-mediated genome instability protein 1 n=1 Tax=Amborella trichopoda TaxID=13333 RepID=W1PF94_AMBTC|nr:recQ-mediated genome instability protein 1 [Amborella trichopoda]ERN06301.1 hypothetical protein AMTR_s00016p00227740 [Amborella trichopoda]|eukprot:XP_006844626.1 recQ-mediated genome instability protein 1 [Amborella trichopoda]